MIETLTRTTALIGAVAAFLLSAGPAPASSIDGQPTSSSGDIRFVIDAATFRGVGETVTEEIYILIPNRELAYVNRGKNGLEADLDVSVAFRRWPSGELLRQESINTKLTAPTSAVARGIHDLQVLQKSFDIEPGPYEVTVEVTDRNTMGFGFFHIFGRDPDRGEASGRFMARRFESEGLEISDFLFTRGMESEAGDAVPNPNRLYGAMMPVLSYYYQVYDNYEGLSAEGEKYFVRHEVIGADGKVEIREDRIFETSGGSGRFEAQMSHDLRALPGGVYKLRVTVRPEARSDSVIAESPFHVVWRKSDLADVAEERAASQADFYAEIDVDEEIRSLRYILVPDDLTLLESMPPDEQRDWIDQYWKDRDPTPETEANELRMEHYARIQHANQRFGSMRVTGMESDRGRIYIRYGEPDQISSGFSAQSFLTPLGGFSQLADQSQVTGPRGGFNVEEKAYEIWTYSERGKFLGERRNRGAGLQLQFVFVDVEGWGKYTLIRSTDKTEF